MPTLTENKVNFGLKNVYYAILTEGTANSFGTPVAIPGAVNLNLTRRGGKTEFKADNVTYYSSSNNDGYDGDAEFARIPEQMLRDVWGIEQDTTSKVLYERTGIEPKPFALLFQIDGDQNNDLYVLYRCMGDKPNIASQTIGETKEPVTQTIGLSSLPLVTGSAAQKGLVLAKAGFETSDTIKNSWFTSVHVPTEPQPEPDPEPDPEPEAGPEEQ